MLGEESVRRLRAFFELDFPDEIPSPRLSVPASTCQDFDGPPKPDTQTDRSASEENRGNSRGGGVEEEDIERHSNASSCLCVC